MEDEKQVEQDRQRSEVFDALGHPTRIRILKVLSECSLGFADLKKKTGIKSSGHLQHHLTKLNDLIRTDEYSKYCLSEEGKDALLAIQTVENMAGGTKRKGKRVNVLWLVTGVLSGSLLAVFSDITKQNPWFLLYVSVALAWIWVLTAIAATQVRGDTKNYKIE
jgi:DNA-binding HxlR family transcriptional regulator